VQYLRPGNDVKPQEIHVGGGEMLEQGRSRFGVYSELLRPTAHAHAGPAHLEVRVDADGSRRWDAAEQSQFATIAPRLHRRSDLGLAQRECPIGIPLRVGAHPTSFAELGTGLLSGR
jgi:hypothetical protein